METITMESSEINPFQFEGRNVRLVDQEGETWFMATDAARELGYREAYDLTRSLDDDEKGTHTVRTPSGDQEMSIISEPGLYRAIIQRRANKKHDASLTAKIGRFQRWVFHDVLPSIRKTGGYKSAPALPDFTSPAMAARAWAEQFEGRQKAEMAALEMAPSVAALDRIAGCDGSLCITEAAKALQIRPKQLFTHMRAKEWIYRRAGAPSDLGYQARVQAGLLEHKVTTILKPDGLERIVEQVRVTPKGLTVLAKDLGSTLSH
jgi:anti-repressor protein